MLRDLAVSSAIGLGGSMALNEPMHRDGVPELARYTAGGVLVLLALAITGDEDGLEDALKAFVGVAIGVGLARLLQG